jgi:hypothetical protein
VQQQASQLQGLSGLLSSAPVSMEQLSGLMARVASLKEQLLPGQEQQAVAGGGAAVAAAGGGKEAELSAEQLPKAWKALATVAGLVEDQFTPVAYVENQGSDTQVGDCVLLVLCCWCCAAGGAAITAAATQDMLPTCSLVHGPL